MGKGGNSKDDEVTSASCRCRLMSNCKRVCLPAAAAISVPPNDGQSLTFEDFCPPLGLVGILAQHANFEAVPGSDRSQSMGAASCAADENANPFSHVVLAVHSVH